MSIINVLPEALANKIAAGEVVERPAAVLKELVENAVDAKANHIKIIIKNAGKSLIQVIDNGTGMDENDCLLAFERHATSKIKDFDDIENIKTMGFRGEAIPSIAAVSQVELLSKREEDKLANLIQVSGAVIQKVEKTASERGTSVSVKNLFYNVPARKNFLKTNATEYNHILTVAKKFFLAHPDIHFEFFQESDQVFNLEKSSAEKRIREVLGDDFFSGMLPVNEQLGDISLDGYVLKPDLARFGRGQQFLFLNTRLVNSKYLNHAIQNAYGHSIDKNQYPGFVLYLNLDPRLIDINVHPTKMEVRFTNDRMIYNFFLTSVQKALNTENVVPQMAEKSIQEVNSPRPEHNIPKFDNNLIKIEDFNFKSPQTFGPGTKRKQKQMVPGQATIPLTFVPKDEVVDERLTNQIQNQGKVNDEPSSEINSSNLWQLHNRYILSQVQSGLVIIDQHVAHERILFEKILKTLNGQKQYHSQQLIFPQTVDLSFEDIEYFTELEELLSSIGYSIKKFSGRTVVIEAIPSDIRIGNEKSSLLEIIDYYKENKNIDRDPYEKMAAAYACRNAIKSGEPLSVKEMHSLIDQLFATSTPYFCPHGRPIIVTIGLGELDKKFKRI